MGASGRATDMRGTRYVSSRGPLRASLCLLASLLVPGIASASTGSGAETRVWAFDLQDQVGVGVERSLTLVLHRGCEPTYDESSRRVTPTWNRSAAGSAWGAWLEQVDGISCGASCGRESRASHFGDYATLGREHEDPRQFPGQRLLSATR